MVLKDPGGGERFKNETDPVVIARCRISPSRLFVLAVKTVLRTTHESHNEIVSRQGCHGRLAVAKTNVRVLPASLRRVQRMPSAPSDCHRLELIACRKARNVAMAPASASAPIAEFAGIVFRAVRKLDQWLTVCRPSP
jgi:hypothetical protein